MESFDTVFTVVTNMFMVIIFLIVLGIFFLFFTVFSLKGLNVTKNTRYVKNGNSVLPMNFNGKIMSFDSFP